MDNARTGKIRFAPVLKCLMGCLIIMALIMGSSTTARADSPPRSDSLDFALIGDMPYNAAQEQEFIELMKVVDSTDLAFIIHAGDFWFDGIAWRADSEGYPPCSNETFQHRLELAQNSQHPFIFVPGDNDWTDCHRARPREYDPLERLDVLRKTFHQGDSSLGRKNIPLVRQSGDPRYAAFRENVRWKYGEVLFVTLHMVGSNNNLGRTEKMDAETERRYLEGIDKYMLGRYAEAIEIWQEIIKDHPYNKKVLEAISGAEERMKRQSE